MAATQWMRELATELTTGGLRQLVAPTLALLDALDEMIEWVDDPREFSSHHKRAWKSAARDLDAARTDAGSSVRGLVESGLARFNVRDAVAEAPSRPNRLEYISLLRDVRDLVVSDEGVEAIWADIVDAARRLAWSEVHVQLHNLVRTHAARADDLSARSWVLAGILRDDAFDVDLARRDLGEPPSLDVPSSTASFDAKAGLSEADRVALASRFLRVQPSEAHFVVWLAVDRATMRRGEFPVGSGSVTVYQSGLIGDALKCSPSERSDRFPDEIRAGRAFTESLPVGERILLARMDMGVRKPSFVARDARMRLLTLLAPIRRIDPTDWSVMSGSVVFRNGEDASVDFFASSAQLDSAHRLDRIGEDWLEGGARDLEPLLGAPASEPLARLLKLVEWDAAHRHGDPVTRVMLAVRTIETVAASHVRGVPWQDLLAAYRNRFAWSWLATELESAASSILHRSDRCLDEHRRDRQQKIFREVITYEEEARATNLELFLKHLPELIEIWDVSVEEQDIDSLSGRGVRIEALQAINSLWTDARVFQTRLDAVAWRIELQERRLRRVRDAAQHGGPILDPSVDSVATIADGGRRQIIADMLDGLINGRTCTETLDAVKELEFRRREVLATARSPMNALAERLRLT